MKVIAKYIGPISLGIPLLLGGIGCSHQDRPTPLAAETIRDLPTMTVQRAELPSDYEAMGTVRAKQTAQLAAQVMGNLVRIGVSEGDRVKGGQVLAVIDDSQTRSGIEGASAGRNVAQQQIAAADAEFAFAESTLARYQSLLDKKSVSPHEFEEVKARYEAAKAHRDGARASLAQAEASVAQARTLQGFTMVRAPFYGVITAKLAETGNLASPGTPLFIVEDTSTFRLETTVDESAMGAVALGQSVPVFLDSLSNESLTGKVVQVLPNADPASRTFAVKIELPRDPRIRSGLFGRARFPLSKREGLAIPEAAIVQRGSLQAVYVLGGDHVASLRYVTLGRAEDASIEVLSGLESGERIIAKPGGRELNGRKIEVQ